METDFVPNNYSPAKKEHSCNVCNKSFMNKNSLKDHTKSEHHQKDESIFQFPSLKAFPPDQTQTPMNKFPTDQTQTILNTLDMVLQKMEMMENYFQTIQLKDKSQ